MEKSKMMAKRGKAVTAAITVIISILATLAVAALIIIPPSFGKMKPFLDENGKVLTGSISEKTFIDADDGVKLGMFIVAKDDTKPVLLFLGGGPGIPEYLLEKEYPTGLENDFIVCYPEYRGTSLSYSPDISADTMTVEQYDKDVQTITDYLCERFNTEKVYLMAHSFGTTVGLRTAKAHPERYYAYIAMAQATNQEESEKLAYSYMREQYVQRGDKKAVAEFDKYPILTSDEAYDRYFGAMLRDKAMHDLGVGTTRKMKSVITDIFFPSLRCTVYTPAERINIWRGKAFASSTAVGRSGVNANTFEEVTSLDLPVYFFGGKYDYTCCYSLQKEYFDMLDAPIKGFYTFDESAHSPVFEEPQKAREILTEDIINLKTELADK